MFGYISQLKNEPVDYHCFSQISLLAVKLDTGSLLTWFLRKERHSKQFVRIKGIMPTALNKIDE